ncbi:KH domain-containing, RNA-binding, signal transduction-associated protein 2 isoform X3 [Poeciliopsis prolifica]|uniref:KH domain-containing, RNA-binding, signal transduction-associated protein 2 isoform X3 n=1 Tax=Poeciliopsis prolifica TaxID=188132 RepID=UPI0024134D42|nr:KH domain-containing, RNA-binding, signal transduction-associated protein 2 isoform X3 [Poeciliopsis prolifica]
MHPNKCLPELMAEKNSLDPSFVHAVRLLAEEIGKYEGDELKKDVDTKKYLDIISNKNIKLSERVLIPIQQYPKFNFVGKLLGPRGNSMKRLQEETGVKMSILGKGSMRDKEKEEELRKSGEAKYAHLCNDLHVLIEVFAPPGEAYSRMSHALEEIKKFLVPDYNDEIRQEQLRELSLLNGSDESSRGRSIQGRSLRTTTTASTIVLLPRGGCARRKEGVLSHLRENVKKGHGGSSRRAATPRGTTAATHSKLPKTALTRDLQAPRARGAAANSGYRPPLLAATHESYDDYGYEDGYDEEYEDGTYEAYDENYSTQTKSISEYYEHGHGTSDESYNSYEEEWTSPRPILKAPALHLTRGGYRKHPYGRY